METGYFSKDNYDDAGELTSISELKAYGVDELPHILKKWNERSGMPQHRQLDTPVSDAPLPAECCQ